MTFEGACRDGALRRQVDLLEASVWDTHLSSHARLLKKWCASHCQVCRTVWRSSKIAI